MSGIEGLFVGLVILFYVVRGIFRGIRSVIAAIRRALTPARRAGASDVRRQAREQMPPQTPSQQRGSRLPPERPALRSGPEPRPRRPEAGGPAVTSASNSAQFGTQMAQIEAQQGPGMPDAAVSDTARAAAAPLFGSGDDLVRAVILQEILAKPLSQRRRTIRHKE